MTFDVEFQLDDKSFTLNDTSAAAAEAAADRAESAAVMAEGVPAMIAPTFSTSTTYAAGDYVIYSGKLYQFTASHSGAWTGTDAVAVTVGGAVDSVQDSVSALNLSVYPIGYGIRLADNKWSATAAGRYNYYAQIKPGDNVYIKANENQNCYYAILKSLAGMRDNAVPDFSAKYASLQGVLKGSEISITAPSDANYIFIFTDDAAYIPSIFEINKYSQFESARDNISALCASTEYLGNNGIINAYDSTALQDGCIINYQDGSAITNQYTSGYAITDFIPISYGDVVHLAYVRGADLCGGALYDANKNFIQAIWGTEDFSRPSTNINSDFEFIIDNRKIAYLRYNVQIDTVFPRGKQYIWITPSKVYKTFEKKVVVGSSEEFTTLKGALSYINDNGIEGAEVYVKPGTYDLVSEFGQEYLDSIVQSTNKGVGLFLGRNTHLIFAEGAYVKFLYNGNNPAVCEYFSPFNITGSFTLENADIEVANCRYCVHEDLPTSASSIPDTYVAKYINCTMTHNGNTKGTYTGTVCIGAGTMKNSLSIIEGGKYTCGNQYPRAISYHNFSTNNHGNYPSKVVLKNVWLNNALRLGTFSTSVVTVEISGCYIPNGITDGNSEFFKITQWNNVGIN